MCRMASAFPDADPASESSNCPLCLNRCEEPRVLPCLHTFCRRCLEAHAASRQSFACPACCEEVYLGDGGTIDTLPANSFIGDILKVGPAKFQTGH